MIEPIFLSGFAPAAATVVVTLLLAACAATDGPAAAAPGEAGGDRAAGTPPPPLPDFRTLWNFREPAATEARFREILPAARASGDTGYLVELLTQIARAQGLQGDFEGAHATLDEAAALWDGRAGPPRVRLLLERGRAWNSAGDGGRARGAFLEAVDAARAAGHEALAVDALHMVAIASPPDEAIRWNDAAIAAAEASRDAGARGWLGALYNNQGWTRYERGELDLALDLFRRGLAFRRERGQEREVLVARWSVAKTLRALGRIEEALAEQRLLDDAWRTRGETDGFVLEEMAECLLGLGRVEEARPWFRRAYEALSKDPWLARDEPERLRRLAELAGP